MSTNNLDSIVFGLSGGVDSAVVLGLLIEAKKEENSPIKRIVPLLMPIFGSGVSNQNYALSKGLDLLNHFDYNDYQVIDLTKSYQELIKSNKLGSALNDDWADGQMASVLRTPTLYYHTALLQSQGYKSIVCGTTNRSEGSYIGFFGKASDAMVDLQPISDIFKSEVYEVAKKLNVTKKIIKSIPSGDVFDNRNDEEMIGTTYEMLEFFTLICDYDSNNSLLKLNSEEYNKILKQFEILRKLHRKNGHKYQMNDYFELIQLGFAKHLDVYKRIIKLL